MEEEETKVEEPQETPKRVTRPRHRPGPLDQERIASRQRAHEFKVAKFLAGGEF